MLDIFLLNAIFLILPSGLGNIPPPSPIMPAAIASSPDEPVPPVPEAVFPVPDGIQPQVEFWKKIFARYDRTYVVIHDSWYLDVIYDVIDMSRLGKRPWPKVKSIRNEYRTLLKETADARNTPELLSPKARRLWELFKGVPESRLALKKDAEHRVRLQIGHAESFKKGMAWSGRYLDMMKEVLKAYQLPEDLAYLPMVESAYNAYSVSYLGATGLWQLMRRTARQYDLRMDHLVDERRDPALATHAAAQHLAHNYDVLQSWPLAVTAYNHGLQGMVTAVKTAGSDRLDVIIQNYDSPQFQFASRNFYAEFLAIIDICNNIETYFSDIEMERPAEVMQFQLPDYVSAATFEQYMGIPSEQIRELNPALLPTIFSSGFYLPKGYCLNLPVADKAHIINDYAAIPGHLKYVHVPASQQRHRVRKGETLSEIAKLHETSARALMYFNGIRNPRRIRVGQHLKIPGKYVALAEKAEGDGKQSGVKK